MINSLLVFSHLRWNFVFQRPQQLMQRLSRDWKIWFFEEPVRYPECFLERTSPTGVRVSGVRGVAGRCGPPSFGAGAPRPRSGVSGPCLAGCGGL